jgi:hypothetical protein
MAGLFRRWRDVWFVVLVWLVLSLPAQACPFCNVNGQTLTGETNQASMVLFGTLTKADPNPREEAPDGTTDLVIEKVVKNHDFLQNRKILTLPRYIPPIPDGNKYKFLVFIDVFKNKLDPYRGVAVKADCDMATYLKGALAVKDEKVEKRLAFFFDYLDNADVEISTDAYKEFGNADYKDYKELAKTLPADRIAGWLASPKTPAFRYGLYASMLGHCGGEKHASMLRQKLDDPEEQAGSGMDGILAGYIMLKPREGAEYLKALLGNPRKGFLNRYAALKAARFFWDFRDDLISHKELTEIMAPLLHMKDIADLVIEDFRRWRHFDMTDRILALQNDPVYNVNVVKRSVLRYALSAKGNQAADRFVATQRQQDPKGVADVEELLKFDTIPAAATPLRNDFKVLTK